MRKISAILLLYSMASFAQIEFEKGYYKDNSGNRHDCLIKNRDWKDTPVQFEVKDSETGAEVVKTANDISEIAIDNTIKFVRADVEIDRSSKNVTFISANKQPVFTKERLFLKILTEGRFALLAYEDKGLKRFFYRKADGTIKQLVYKKYYPSAAEVSPRGNPNVTDYTVTRENNQYRVQLWSDVRCEKTDIRLLDKLKYESQSLANYFRQVNECYGPQSSEPVFTSTRRKGKFYVKLAAGIQQQSLTVERQPSYLSSDMSQTGFSFGAEAEYIFPWNNNKWSMILEPHYNSFEGKSIVGTTGPYDNSVTIEFTYWSLPIGMRHYMFLNDESKLFFSGVVALYYVPEEKWDYERSGDLFVLETLYNFGIGFGYDYKRYSAEIRYYSPMTLNNIVDNKFSRFGLTARYRLF